MSLYLTLLYVFVIDSFLLALASPSHSLDPFVHCPQLGTPCFLSSCDLGCFPQGLLFQLGSAVSDPGPRTLLGRPQPRRWDLHVTI